MLWGGDAVSAVNLWLFNQAASKPNDQLYKLEFRMAERGEGDWDTTCQWNWVAICPEPQ